MFDIPQNDLRYVCGIPDIPQNDLRYVCGIPDIPQNDLRYVCGIPDIPQNDFRYVLNGEHRYLYGSRAISTDICMGVEP